MGKTRYDSKDATSIFAFSKGLLHKSLAEAIKIIAQTEEISMTEYKGKGGFGQLVEKF